MRDIQKEEHSRERGCFSEELPAASLPMTVGYIGYCLHRNAQLRVKGD